VEIKNDWNQILDVLDRGGLAVQVSDGRGLGGDRADVVVVERVVVALGVGAKAIPESGGLLLQGVRLRALLVKGGSGGADLRRSASAWICRLRSSLVVRREAASVSSF